MSHRFPTRQVAPAAVLMLALVAAAVAGVVAHAGISGATTSVTVTETDFHLALSKTALQPGTYTFVTVNKGKTGHSLDINGPGVSHKRIAGTIKPGASRTITVTLKSGTYEIYCPIDGHRKLGMDLKLKVAASGGGATPTPAPKPKAAWG